MRTSAAEHAPAEPTAGDEEGRSLPLVRAIGRRDLTAAVVNAVIGSGVFTLPAAVAALTGPWSPAAVLLFGLAISPSCSAWPRWGAASTRQAGRTCMRARRSARAWGFTSGGCKYGRASSVAATVAVRWCMLRWSATAPGAPTT